MRTRFMALCGSMMVIAACASHKSVQDPVPDDATPPGEVPQNPPPEGSVDAGVPVVVDSGNVDAPAPVDSGPKNQAECVKACETSHPTAHQQDVALTTCMLGPCETVCNDLGTGGATFGPDAVDGGVVCDTDKANSFPIRTQSAACSTCLAKSCCTLWTTLFSSPQGQDLLACSNKCFTDFKN